VTILEKKRGAGSEDVSFFFAFTQKAKAMATRTAIVSLIMSELQLIVAEAFSIIEQQY
jgi:hypothetical protein